MFFKVRTSRVLNQDVLNATSNAIMIGYYKMGSASRKRATPEISRFWKSSRAPEWEKAMKEAIDLVKVHEVMEG